MPSPGIIKNPLSALLSLNLFCLLVIGIPVFNANISSYDLFNDVFMACSYRLNGREFPAWMGVFSNLGVFLWIVGGSIAIFSALRSTKEAGHLLSMGLLSLLLAMDDFFMLHDRNGTFSGAFPHGEKVFYFTYFFLLLFTLYRFRKNFLRSAPLLVLLISLVFFSFSAAMDLLKPMEGEFRIVIEDGLKWMGICHWTSYLLLESDRVFKPD